MPNRYQKPAPPPRNLNDTVWMLLNNAGWESGITPMRGKVVKILDDKKGVRYRVACVDFKTRTKTAAQLFASLDEIGKK